MIEPAPKDAAAVGESIIKAQRRRRDERYFQFLLRCRAHSRYNMLNEHVVLGIHRRNLYRVPS